MSDGLPGSLAALTRRHFISRLGGGFGGVALASLLAQNQICAADSHSLNPLSPRVAHFPAKATSVIWLFMNGGQSQVDTWDYKPEIEKRDGKSLDGFDSKTGFFPEQVGGIMKSPFKFAQHGQSGTWVSEILPNLARAR